ncbi:MAG: type II toxin-antitoxin system HicB family antitoxin [Candidatus Omnitrophica bacterium]|nr:hypothetical protein [bacterium]NUN98299.1 type II toxin-antitoxin system HicB family antitoxin [Candidatus Omnitrophota bacterium]
MSSYTYTVHLEPDEEGGYTVTVPALPGCVTEGDDYEEAMANAQEAILCYLESLLKDGEPIPLEPQPVGVIDIGLRVEFPVAV